MVWDLFNKLGETKKAIEYYEQVLEISKDIGARTNEGMALSNIASEYTNLGETQKAYEYYREALQNAREIGNKYGESKRLNGLAGVFIEKGDFQNAINHSQESLRIGQEMSSPEVCIESSNTLAIAFLFSKNLKEALQVVQDAEKYDQPDFIFNVSALHGIIALRQGERETAQEAFTRSIAQADKILARTPEYYEALDAKGLALCGLVLTQDLTGLTESRPDAEGADEDLSGLIPQAIETFRTARKIAPHAGIVKKNLRLFDELGKCDSEGLLEAVREAVEGKESINMSHVPAPCTGTRERSEESLPVAQETLRSQGTLPQGDMRIKTSEI